MSVFKMANDILPRRGTRSHKISQCFVLTHWGRVMHICISNLTIIGSDNGFSPSRCQAIFATNFGILLIRPLWIKFREILIEIDTFSFKKMYLKMSSTKWHPFCLSLNVLKLLRNMKSFSTVDFAVIWDNNAIWLFTSEPFCQPLQLKWLAIMQC